MARQVITLGASPFPGRTWTGGVELDPVLIAGGATAFLRFLAIAPGGAVQFRTAITASGSASDPGPEMSAAWRTSATAITLAEAGGDSIVVAGPPATDTEPYNWSPTNAAAVSSWLDGLGTGIVTVTLHDGAVGLDDFNSAGLTVEVLGLIQTGSETEPWNADGSFGLLGMGSDMALDRMDATINRVRFGADDISLNRTGGDAFNAFFSEPADQGAHLYDDSTLYIQTATELVVAPCSFEVSNVLGGVEDAGGGFIRLGFPADPGGQQIIDMISAGDQFLIAIARPAPALALPDPPDIAIDWGEDITGTLPDATGGTPPRVYAATGLPSPILFDADTRMLSGQALRVGTHTVTYTVTDDAGGSASQDFDIVISAVIPADPNGLLVNVESPTGLSLTVVPGGHSGGAQISGWPLEVSTDGINFAALAMIPTTGNYHHTGLVTGQTYHYRVYAQTAAGRSAGFAAASGVPQVTVVVRGVVRSGVPVFSGRGEATQPVAVRGIVESGIPVFTGRGLVVQAPQRPMGLMQVGAGLTFVDVEWIAPDPMGEPITGYDARVGAGQWIPTNTTATQYRIDGLEPGNSYTVTVRAVGSLGAGSPSDPLTVRTLAPEPPSVPRNVRVEATGERSLDVSHERPESDGGLPILRYEVCVEPEHGEPEPFETAALQTRHRVRGLAFGHRYGFRVRAVNAAGTGPQSDLVQATVAPALAVTVPEGFQVPLADTDRQTFTVRLGVDTRMTVWWNPTDLAWFASLEAPAGTPVVTGRRLTVNAGLLAGVPDVLAGDVVCRAIDDADQAADPLRVAWSAGTHGLFWEPA